MKAESNPRLWGLMTCEEASWFKCQGCLIFCLVDAKKPRLEHAHTVKAINPSPKDATGNIRKPLLVDVLRTVSAPRCSAEGRYVLKKEKCHLVPVGKHLQA